MTITVTVEDKTYEMVLREPGFEELSLAYNALLSGMANGQSGIPNLSKAGKVLIDTCIDQNQSDKMFYDMKMGGKLMLSADIKAAQIVEVFDAELKKN
jgi:hypothetical protein